MAKNRKQDRSQQKTAVAERPQEQRSLVEHQPEHHAPQVTPTDMARKGRQKRFGHN
ncbi:hypothetical protein [Streptomyces sp. NPDC046197]|uniref:hypothetical protein n=1 Tax=Streptomyces sp. NPDC046197 TaxID=3154337 RepID=UPI0033C435CA